MGGLVSTVVCMAALPSLLIPRAPGESFAQGPRGCPRWYGRLSGSGKSALPLIAVAERLRLLFVARVGARLVRAAAADDRTLELDRVALHVGVERIASRLDLR